jgi:hypothetical protein
MRAADSQPPRGYVLRSSTMTPTCGPQKLRTLFLPKNLETLRPEFVHVTMLRSLPVSY